MINVANRQTINALALRQIKAGKSRNLFAVCAIVLTSVLVTAVLSMGAGLMDANRLMLMKTSGQKAEVSFQHLTAEEAGLVASHPLIEKYGLSRFVARADDGVWASLPVEIKTMDSSFADYTFSTPTTGRLPQSKNEVAVKSWMLDKLGLPRELGQTFPLSFAVGSATHSLNLTVCGIWDDDYYLHPFGFAIISDVLADALLAGADPAKTRVTGEYSGVTQLAADLGGRQSDLGNNLAKIVADTGIDGELVAPRVEYAYDNTALDARSAAALALIVLIVMISGYLLIYNIFHISVIRDIKHYGLLKTIGATRCQIRRIVNLQALMYCIVGVPLGLVLGYVLAAVLFPYFLAITALDGSATLAAPHFAVFAAAALLSLATVFASCSHPARIAGRISPVDATRYTGAAAAKAAQKKSAKRGQGGAKLSRMALDNLFRNRKKTAITLASVLFGLILFNIVFTFTNSFDANKMLKFYMRGDFLVADGSYLNMANSYLTPAHTLTEETVDKIAALDGVSDVAKVYYRYYSPPPKDGDTPVPAQQIYGMDDHWLDDLKESARAGSFDKEKFLSGKYAVIGADTEGRYGVGDTITLNSGNGTDGKQYEVMAIIDTESLYALSARFLVQPGVSAYLPASELKGGKEVDIMSATVFASEDRRGEVRAGLTEIVMGAKNVDFRSRTDYAEEMKNNNMQFSLVGISLCMVVIMIGLLNFINTTITNIMSRKYEFAMLQAIGMTARQSVNMLVLEGAYFVLIAASVFASAGYAASFGIVRMLTENTAAYTYSFTALPLLTSLPLLLVVAIIVPRMAYRAISRDSVVERLREIA